MNSTKSIKIRFSLIIGGISILFIINLIYLIGLYNTIANEITILITSSIEKADIEELQYRLKSISGLSNATNRSISFNKVVEIDRGRDQDLEAIGSSSSNTDVFNQLMKEIRLTVHHSIDTIIPPNISLLDSLIVENCRSKGISTHLYYSEIIDLKTDSVMSTSNTEAVNPKTMNSYFYEYDPINGYAYKIYMASVTKDVLERMSGILITTLLIIFILGYAFWFFIQTIIKQKTLEEMKQDFTNNMTHELKTPISIAYSAIDTLLHFKQGEDSEKRKQYLNICIEQLSILLDFVEQILSMSMERNKNIPLDKEHIELEPLLCKIITQQKLKACKDVNVDILVPPELIIYADRTQLNSIIGNLIDNSLKYSSDNVMIEVNAYKSNNHHIISIKDNGMGISEENQKHIFDRYFRVPHGNLHKVKGYGLGLFHVKIMVERHNGVISVKSTLNKGSEFIIKLPIR